MQKRIEELVRQYELMNDEFDTLNVQVELDRMELADARFDLLRRDGEIEEEDE